jgi:type VI secretion system secreted protein VgrG
VAYTDQEKFTFISQGLPEDTFGVVEFQGQEGLSQCYRFVATLVTSVRDLDMETVLRNPAVFTIRRAEGDLPFHGIIESFEQLQAFNEYVFYRAELAPKFRWLTLTHHNQVFLNKKVPEILRLVLKDGGLSELDFELRLQRDYQEWEYLCQYRESHFNFVSRWMEREGVYYFFEQTPLGEKLILTDTNLAHTPMPQGRTLSYSPPSGMQNLHREEIIMDLVCHQKLLPQRVELKDYNYRTPSLEMSGRADVAPELGRGLLYLYGEHFLTPEEGDSLARIRAEELLCREKTFLGDSTIPFLRPGYVFSLEDHFREEYNQSYLTISLEHRGSQAGYLLSGLGEALSGTEEKPYYQNSFVLIPAEVQFRPERRSPRARIDGAMNAFIDGAGSGKYAELDQQGRYKVILPFDQSGRKDGKASAYIRMAQPYGGSDHGFHFPLRKGTEVILVFADGDPDRPIIAGAAPNPENPSQATADNQTKCVIQTPGGNHIHMEDQAGSERILLQTPTSGTWMRLGTPNDPPPQPAKGMAGYALFTRDWLTINAGLQNTVIIGESTKGVGGFCGSFIFISDNKWVVGLRTDITIGPKTVLHMGGDYQWATNKWLGWPVHVRTVGEEIEDYVNQNHVIATKNMVKAEVTRAVGERNDAIVNAINLDGAKQNVRGMATDVHANFNVAIATHQQAFGQKMRATATALNTMAAHLDSAGNNIKAIGVKTEESGLAMTTAGNHLKSAATIIRDAGLIVD